MPPRPAIRPALLSSPAGSSFSLALRPSSFVRSFSQSTTRHAENRPQASRAPRASSTIDESVPPDSPNFIKFPKPPQSEEVYHPPQRGHLPVPRDVFNVPRTPGRTKEQAAAMAQKSDPVAFVASVAPRSQAEIRGEEPHSEREALRRRLAESRRQSLEAGLAGLWTRKAERSQRERARAANIANRNRRAALFKPEGRDDVLTRPSVRDATAKSTAVIRDPLRHEKQAASAARTAALAQQKREARRDALMDLYQAAGNFIVDEKDLERRVSQLFRPDYFKEEGYSYGTVNAENIWDIMGAPTSLREQIADLTRSETKLFDSKRSELDRTTKRQKLVTEALTGGKMPV
ncbi:hypothetical protein SEUCBS139899_000035 [Sporothrix eucalyptigena]|uniref:Uncharacterized protein n=1 Tax=Sporothrix eucalyptigena TaxID=1812306 RepID=A0ABP0AR48_9PEZI